MYEKLKEKLEVMMDSAVDSLVAMYGEEKPSKARGKHIDKFDFKIAHFAISQLKTCLDLASEFGMVFEEKHTNYNEWASVL